jgi:DNA repair exonuclease SbcCD nuclease subunit
MDDYPNTILNKLEEVAKIYHQQKWKFLIITGDIFDKKSISWIHYIRLVSILESLNVYAVVGNHDMFNEKLESLPRTPLGALFASGIITHLDGVHLNGLLTGIPFMQYPEVPPAPTECLPLPRILVCHAYVGKKKSGFTGKENDWILYDQLKEAGYEIVIAGHDHREYKMINPKGSNAHIFRCGALSRGTANEQNQDRQPQALEIDVHKSGTWEWSLIEIPAPLPEKVFAATDMALKDVNRDLKHLVQNLETLSAQGLDAGGLGGAINMLEIPDEIYTLMQGYATDFGLTLPERST